MISFHHLPPKLERTSSEPFLTWTTEGCSGRGWKGGGGGGAGDLDKSLPLQVLISTLPGWDAASGTNSSSRDLIRKVTVLSGGVAFSTVTRCRFPPVGFFQ